MKFWNFCPLVSADIEEVDNYMKEAVKSRKQVLTDISHDLIESGGKRLRPGFLILAAQLGKYNRDKILPYAAAIELIHTATLVHDDIIDESPYRRNKESTHQKWGRDMAIYTGDYLFTKAFSLLSNKDKSNFSHLNHVARAMQSICEGEIDQYEQKYKIQTVFDYLKRIQRKSALLFAMSTTIGAQEAGCSKKVSKAIGLYGLYFGVAFQIYDDLLDYTETHTNIGKPIGNDIREGNYTLPLLYALNDPVYSDPIKELLAKKDKISEAEVKNIISYVNKTESINQSMQLAYKFIGKAEKQLSIIPNKNDVIPYFQQLLYKLFPKNQKVEDI